MTLAVKCRRLASTKLTRFIQPFSHIAPHAHCVSLAYIALARAGDPTRTGLHSESYKIQKTMTQEVLSMKGQAQKKQANLQEVFITCRHQILLQTFFYASNGCSICTITFNLLLDTDDATHSLTVTCNVVACIISCIKNMIINMTQNTHCTSVRAQQKHEQFGSHLIPLQFVQSLKGDNHEKVIDYIIQPQLVGSKMLINVFRGHLYRM